MVCSLPGSSVHGILQARILEWVAMPSSRGSSWPRDQTGTSLMSPALAGRFFTTSTTWGALKSGRHSSGFIGKGAGPCSDKAKCLSMPCPCYLASSGNSQTWPTEQESQVRNWAFPIETASVSAWPKRALGAPSQADLALGKVLSLWAHFYFCQMGIILVLTHSTRMSIKWNYTLALSTVPGAK